ncbi:uncharacterized protein LDX57_006502 [Aspergillus melleus]|uniref:uncharacterized protein n=1 Tax=Aspergillus melleus TaxID=138277 RepID=UPI001E8CC40A|nr:uncharacterized protein LDX57_006502 [Aspergillus melleus]KAH8428823.1 hypothetical protein LDX57_006502 [Aspergillus melleus]
MSQRELQEIQELRRRLEEEQRLRKEEQRRREKAEEEFRRQTQDTTLPEFLDACHLHSFLVLKIQQDKSSTTQGNPANADRKLRPARIREWSNFPEEQILIWDDLMNTDFVTERHFTSLILLKGYGAEIRERMLGSELDLSYFERQTVESRVASVIKQLYAL